MQGVASEQNLEWTSSPAERLKARRGGGRLSLDRVSHHFHSDRGKTAALSSIDLVVERGEFVAVVGRSGCGKSTLLNILAGLVTPSEGQAAIEDDGIDDGLPRVGYVTQHDSLLPWRTALQNTAFPLELHGFPLTERLPLARAFLETVGLADASGKYPHELSGGMRQRLSLARTLIYRPSVLLMDEPFGALDAQTKSSLHDLLQKVWRDTNTTVVFVTHDLLEAISLADRIVTLSSQPGRVKNLYKLQEKSPRDITRIHEHPILREVYASIRADLGIS